MIEDQLLLSFVPRRPRCRPRRQLVIVVPAEAYDVLAADAASAERDVYQHARWLLLDALAKRDDREPVAV